jgi:hypothetical protein
MRPTVFSRGAIGAVEAFAVEVFCGAASTTGVVFACENRTADEHNNSARLVFMIAPRVLVAE